MIKIGFIDYYLDEWHADNYPRWIAQNGGGDFSVVSAYGDIEGTEFGRRSNAEFCAFHGIKLATSIEEVISNSDCLIVLSPDHPEEHVRLSDLALRSGKPVYVDKTFAVSRADAQCMFSLADQYGTPLYSSSALRFSTAYQNLPNKPLQSLVSRGGGYPYNYAVHQLEPIIKLLGTDLKRVMSWGAPTSATFLLDFHSGKKASFSQTSSQGFSMDLYYGENDEAAVNADDEFFLTFMTAMLDFFRSSLQGQTKPPVDREETLAIMAARELILKGLEKTGEWITTESLD